MTTQFPSKSDYITNTSCLGSFLACYLSTLIFTFIVSSPKKSHYVSFENKAEQKLLGIYPEQAVELGLRLAWVSVKGYIGHITSGHPWYSASAV